MAFDVARIPDKLKTAYKEKRCAVLVGAGASAGAGLPLWGPFLELMIAEAQNHLVISDAKAKEYRALVSNPGKFMMVASGLKEDLKVFSTNSSRTPSSHRSRRLLICIRL